MDNKLSINDIRFLRGVTLPSFFFVFIFISIYEDVIQPQRERRGSYPLTEEMIRQRELHRCKAKHKANITLTHLLNEWKKKSEQLKSETKRVKSEPHLRRAYSKGSGE